MPKLVHSTLFPLNALLAINRSGRKKVSGTAEEKRCQERMALSVATKGLRFKQQLPVQHDSRVLACSSTLILWGGVCSREVRCDLVGARRAHCWKLPVLAGPECL